MAGITHGRWSRCGLLLAALAVFAAHAGDDPPGAVARKVVKLEAGAQAFVADGDGFRHDGPAQGRLSLPAPPALLQRMLPCPFGSPGCTQVSPP